MESPTDNKESRKSATSQWCRKKIDDAPINHNITGAVKNIDIIDDAKKEKLG